MNFIKNNLNTIIVLMFLVALNTIQNDIKLSLSNPINTNTFITIEDKIDLSVNTYINLIDNNDLGSYICTSENEEIVTLKDCSLLALKVGKTNIKIDFILNNETTVLESKSIELNIYKYKTNITGYDKKITLNTDDKYTLSFDSKSIKGTYEYEYDKNIIKINNNEIIPLKKGNTKLKFIFKPLDIENYEIFTDEIDITINEMITPKIISNDITIYKDSIKSLDINIDTPGTYKLTSNNENIVSIVNYKEIKANNIGNTTVNILFTPDDLSKYKKTSIKINVNVKEINNDNIIDSFIENLKYYIKDKINYNIIYDNNILHLYYCINDCNKDSDDNKVVLNLYYNNDSQILKLNNSINVINIIDNDYELTNQYKALLLIINYLNDNYKTSINKLKDYIINTGKEDSLITINNSGINMYYSDIVKLDTNIPKTINSFEVCLSKITEGEIYTIKVNNYDNNLINSITNINGKDIVKLNNIFNKNNLDKLIIRDINNKDITNKTNYNLNDMTFEISNSLLIEPIYINNKTNNIYLLLIVTIVIFILSLFIVRKDMFSIEI